MAGFEAIVVTGRAAQPVYLWIHDGQAEIRQAAHLWGHETANVQETIRTELGDEKIRVLQIGIAGENLVRYAGLTNDLAPLQRTQRDGRGDGFQELARNCRARQTTLPGSCTRP